MSAPFSVFTRTAVRVNTENGALIAAFPPGRQQQVIPVLHGPHMAVDLQQKVFPAVNTLGLSTGPAGTTAFRGIEPDDLQLWMIRKRAGSPVGWVISSQLQADAEAQAFWLGCPLDQVVQCGWEIRIPVSRDLNKDRGTHQRAAAMRSVWLMGPTSCTRSLPCLQSF